MAQFPRRPRMNEHTQLTPGELRSAVRVPAITRRETDKQRNRKNSIKAQFFLIREVIGRQRQFAAIDKSTTTQTRNLKKRTSIVAFWSRPKSSPKFSWFSVGNLTPSGMKLSPPELRKVPLFVSNASPKKSEQRSTPRLERFLLETLKR